jgi:hypothetical protein
MMTMMRRPGGTAPPWPVLPAAAFAAALIGLLAAALPAPARAHHGPHFGWHYDTRHKLFFLGTPESDNVQVSFACGKPGHATLVLVVKPGRAPAAETVTLRVAAEDAARPGRWLNDDFRLRMKRSRGDEDSGADVLEAVVPLRGGLVERLAGERAARFGAVGGPRSQWRPLWDREPWVSLEGARVVIRKLQALCG